MGISHSEAGIQLSNRQFLWCDNDICEEHTPAGVLTKRFFAQGVQIAAGAQTGSYYYTRDHLFSIRDVTDANGNSRAQYSYDPYGRQSLQSGNFNADFGFAGMLWSPEAALNLTKFRPYAPDLGRWLSRDPLRENIPQDPQNLYTYVSNDPENRIDPFGLCDCSSQGDAWNNSIDRQHSVCGRGLILYLCALAGPIGWPAIAGSFAACQQMVNEVDQAKNDYLRCLEGCAAQPPGPCSK